MRAQWSVVISIPGGASTLVNSPIFCGDFEFPLLPTVETEFEIYSHVSVKKVRRKEALALFVLLRTEVLSKCPLQGLTTDLTSLGRGKPQPGL
jgi:hypothetical protein